MTDFVVATSADLTSNGDGNAGRQWRCRIPNSQLLSAAERIKVLFDYVASWSLSSAWIGNSATIGSWNFDGNQKQLFFSGSPGKTFSGETYSDELDFVVDLTKDLIISLAVTSSGIPYGNVTGRVGYYAVGGDTQVAATTNTCTTSTSYIVAVKGIVGISPPFDPSTVPNNKKIKLSLDSSTISTDQIDFPLTIKLDNNNPLHAALFADLGANSKKLSIEAEGAQCPVEVEYWDIVGAYDAYTVLLIKSDTTDGSATFVDSSSNPKGITSSGVTHKNTQSKFGATSIYFDDVNQNRLLLNDSTDFLFDGDFTIDQWVFPLGSNGSLSLVNYVSTNNLHALFFDTGSSARVLVGGSNVITGIVFTPNVWSHYALVRSGSTLKAYVNGVQSGTTGTKTGNIGGSTYNYIGGSTASHTGYGYVDELRVSKGIARWTENFTPPDSAYQPSGPSAVIHTKVPLYSASYSTVLILSYDSSQSDNVDYIGVAGSIAARNVWNSNYEGIWNMAQDPSGTAPQLIDSTSNGRHMTTYGTMTTSDLVDGGIGKAIDFDGSDDYASATNIPATAEWTFEAFVKPILTESGDGIFHADGDGLVFSDGKIGLLDGSNVIKGGTTVVNNVWIYLAGTSDGKVYQNGVDVSASLTNNGWVLSGVTRIASGYLARKPKMQLDFAAKSNVVRSADWIKLSYSSITDQLITFSSFVTSNLLISFLDQTYDLLPDSLLSCLNQLYAILQPNLNFNDQIFSAKMAALLNQKWGDSAVITSKLDSWYGSMPTVRKSLWQSLGNLQECRSKVDQLFYDAPVLRTALTELYDTSFGLVTAISQVFGNPKDNRQKIVQDVAYCLELRNKLFQQYGSAIKIVSKTDQQYTARNTLINFAEQVYAISEGAVQSILSQSFNIAEYNSIISSLHQFYMVAANGAVNTHTFSVTIGGREIPSVFSASVEAGRSSYFMTGDLSLSSYEDFIKCSVLDPVVINHNGMEYNFIVESKSRSRSPGIANYIVSLVSPSAILDEPNAKTITTGYPAGMASDISKGIVAYSGVTLNWDIVDWPIPNNTLYAADETPLAVVRRIVSAAGGILQSLPDGSLNACYAYPVDIDKLSIGTIDHYFTDSDNIFSVSETTDLRSGDNVYLISDGLLSDSSYSLKEIEIDQYNKIVQAYIVPWAEGGVNLFTSGGTWVSVEPLGVETEELEEQVEFVNGESSTGSPIYELLSVDWNETLRGGVWRETSLGPVTYSEDGSLKSEVAAESLATIRYKTKYHKWLVKDNNVEDVQFILQAD